MKIKSIRTRLLLILLPFIFVILGILSGVSYYFSEQALTKSVNDMAKSVGNDYANRIQANITEEIIRLEELSNVPSIRNGNDRAQIVATLAEANKRYGKFDVMNFIFLDGMSVRSNGTTVSLGDRAYFKKVVATKKPAISDPLVAKSTGKVSVTLCVPVLNNGQLTGVLTATYPLDTLSDLVKEVNFKDSGRGFIVAKNGLVIAHPELTEIVGKLNLGEKKIDPELKLKETELDDNLTSLFKNGSESNIQVVSKYTFNGITHVGVATPFTLPGDQQWIMIVAAPNHEVTREINTLSKTLLAVSLLCLLIAALSIVVIAKKFVRPIEFIRDECLLLAKGDLRDQEVRVNSEDEIGQLAQGFRSMRTQLQELITKIHAQAEQLAASSEELTANSDQSAQASNQIASSITEMATGASAQMEATNEASAVVEQMSAGIQQIAANVNRLSDHSAAAADKAKNGDQAVKNAVQQMNQIQNTVNSSAQVVVQLGDQSKEIGQIVDTISGIAGQTNLLALNAAIEAARAGEQGRGFAVVADEVRKLAEQSQAAAKKIAELIAKIQNDTDKAVVAMNEGTQEVETGTEVVNAAGVAFKEIIGVVSQVSDQVQEISAAIQQMASGSQQIVGSVKKIDDLSKKSAAESQGVSATTEEQLASMEEIASSSQSLAKLAQDLQAAVFKFKV